MKPEDVERMNLALQNIRLHDQRCIEHLARSMHETLCGSWDAAGYDVKHSFRLAGAAAFAALKSEGWDLFSFPEGGWSAIQ